MADFERDGRVDLAYGVVLHSSQVGGRAGEVRQWAGAYGSVREAEPETLTDQLTADSVPAEAARLVGTQLQEAGLRPVLTLPLSELTVAPNPGERDRADAAVPSVVVQVPAPLEDEGQVVLEVDATGVVRWVFSEAATRGVGLDRSGAVQTFRVPVEQFAVPGEERDRGLFGFGIRKVLHVLRFPIDRAAGWAAELAMARWEDRYRPYRLRLTTPGTFLDPSAGEPVTPERLAGLADRPFLVFVHGTFSRCHAGFHGVADDEGLLRELHQRYQDRVLTFDHPTAHQGPAANARWLLQQLPTDRPLTLDLLTHSRGGLVGRLLSQDSVVRDAGSRAPTIRTLIHVATPNAGTVLASKQRLGDLLTVFTNLFALLPVGAAGVTVAVVLEVVKHCATGVLGGLDGLAAMDPASGVLGDLNAAGARMPANVHAVTSDYEPAAGAGLAVRALDLMADRLFAAHNDLVVPTEGVYQAGSYSVQNPLLIPPARAVPHHALFQHPQVRAQLAQWLPGG